MKKKFIIEDLTYGGYFSSNGSFHGLLFAFKFDSEKDAELRIEVLPAGNYSIKPLYIKE